ncbi:hypothetical protein BDZ89DRAFT_1046839 [Hymenopellis radicata]|nr:hypothetical protein BDZ89DRAFT_1046839 [Hymenopellis radicata]
MPITSWPQELLDIVIDILANLHHDSLWSLLASHRRFGPRCRVHLYRQVTLKALCSDPQFDQFITKDDIAPLIKTFRLVFAGRAPVLIWDVPGKIMLKLPRLEVVVLSQDAPYTIPFTLLCARLPELSSVKELVLHSLRKVSMKDLTIAIGTCPNISRLEVSDLERDLEPDENPIQAPIGLDIQELCLIDDASAFVTSIFPPHRTGPPVISLNKLRLLVINQVFNTKTWRAYEALLEETRDTMAEVIIYLQDIGSTPDMSFILDVPSVIIITALDSDFDFLATALEVDEDETLDETRLERLAVVFDWSEYQLSVEWENLVDLLDAGTLPFRVCVTLAVPPSATYSPHQAALDATLIGSSFKGMEGTAVYPILVFLVVEHSLGQSDRCSGVWPKKTWLLDSM